WLCTCRLWLGHDRECYDFFKFVLNVPFQACYISKPRGRAPNSETIAHGLSSAGHQKSPTSPLQVATTEAGCAGGSSPSHGWDAGGDGLACDVPCATAAAHGRRQWLSVRGREGSSMERIDYIEFASIMESFGITDRRFIAPGNT